MQTRDIDEIRLLGGALVALGLALGGAAAATGILAADHMAAAAELCGPTADHCGLCVAAGALLLAALGAAGAGIGLLVKPRPALQRAATS